jgi:hypothetical protein
VGTWKLTSSVYVAPPKIRAMHPGNQTMKRRQDASL